MLENKAVLVVDALDRTAEFHMREIDSNVEEINRSFLLSERGQYLTEAVDFGADLIPDDLLESDPGRRKGYHLDCGAGSRQLTLEFGYAVEEDGQWGDGSGGTGPENVTIHDATGAHPQSAKDVFANYMAQGRSDSGGQTCLHIGEWTDGSFSDEEGVFGEPLTVAVNSARAERSGTDPSAFSGTLEMTVTETYPDITGLIEDFEEGLNQLGEDLRDIFNW